MFDIVLGIFLFLSPIFFLYGKFARLNGTILSMQYQQFKTLSLENNIIQFQFFEYGIILLFIIALAQKPLRFFQDKWIALFLGLCTFSVILHPKTLSAFLPIFLGVLFYYLIIKYTKNIKKLFYPIVLVSALNTIFAILQFFTIYFIYHPPISDGHIIYGRYDGLMTISNHMGIYQALVLPICYSIHPLLSIIPLIGLLLSKSLTAVFAGIVGMVYLLYPERKKIFINLAPIGLTVLLTLFGIFIIRNYHSGIYKIMMRLDIWLNTLKEIIKSPLIGYGLNSFKNISPKFTAKYGISGWVYNEYLEIVFCIGIFSLFFIFMFLKDKFKNVGVGLTRYIATSCLIATIICLGQPAMHFPRLTGTIIPLFAFLGILKRKENLC